MLLDNVRDNLSTRWKDALEAALHEVGLSCMSRITREAHPELGDQADVLLNAATIPEMTAAQQLRLTAFDVRHLLMHPVLTNAYLQFDPSVLDPEQRRMELADLATDVATATDYLLSLLATPASISPLILDSEAGFGRGRDSADAEALDRLTRQRLEARATAVRLGVRLLSGLRSDVADR